jgi:hypothetical protein
MNTGENVNLKKFVLGNYLDFEEDLQNEFKEFYLKLDISNFLTFEEIKHMVLTGELCRGFDEIIFCNLKQYINVYLPKYISAFGNTEEISEGHFYIGINDFGEITGIPFSETLDETVIRSFLELTKPFLSVSSLDRSLSEDSIIDQIIASIKIEIIKIEANTFLLEDECKNELDEYNYKRNEFRKAYKSYILKHTAWVEEMLSYASKLVEYVSDPKLRNDIADYILNSEDYKSIDVNHFVVATMLDGTKLECSCEKVDLDNCITILKSNEIIPIYDSVRLADIKLNPKHVLYWVMIYKDYMTQIIRQRRPIKPCDTVYNEELFYNNMLRFISKMRYKFLSNDSKLKNSDSQVSMKLNYYIIKFIIPANSKHDIFYSNMNSDLRWIKKVRGYMSGNVGCI